MSQSAPATTSTALIGPATTVPPTTLIPTTTTPSSPPSAHLTSSTTHVTAGERVTVTGTGCPVGSWIRPYLHGGPNSPWILDGPNMGDIEAFLQTGSGIAEGAVGREGLWRVTGKSR
jgi:hypothetical protein